jgi:D-psicose/D-tagatose/L-ribulose 3-epimerase
MWLSVLASTPDISTTGYMVNLLLGTPREVTEEARALGYDGIELLPGPPGTVGVTEMAWALRAADVGLTAVNSGRVVAQGLTLLHPVPGIRQRAILRFRDLLDFAGSFGVPVTLAGAKGMVPEGLPTEDVEAMAEEAFRGLADFATRAGSLLLLTPTHERDSNLICTVSEAIRWVQRINHPGFGMMLDTYQLALKEPSVLDALRAAAGRLRHLHLYDPGRMPPGTGAKSPLDWPAIIGALQAIGYEGAASVCLAPAGDRPAQAARTVAYLKALIGEGPEEEPGLQLGRP